MTVSNDSSAAPERAPYYGETAHPKCSPEAGHVCRRPSGRACLECTEPAGTLWGPYWCPDHDAARLDTIGRELRRMAGGDS